MYHDGRFLIYRNDTTNKRCHAGIATCGTIAGATACAIAALRRLHTGLEVVQ